MPASLEVLMLTLDIPTCKVDDSLNVGPSASQKIECDFFSVASLFL